MVAIAFLLAVAVPTALLGVPRQGPLVVFRSGLAERAADDAAHATARSQAPAATTRSGVTWPVTEFEPSTPTTEPAPTTTTTTAPEAPATAAPPSSTTTAPPSSTTTTVASDPDISSNGVDPGTGDLHARVRTAFDSAVSAQWRGSLLVSLEVRSGSTSMATADGRIQISERHASGDWGRLRAIVAHEYGHVIAYNYGRGRYLGDPPQGWPRSGINPAERWADCVARTFTGYALGAHGQVPCYGASLDWTVDYISRGPP